MAHFDLSFQDSPRRASTAFDEILGAVRFVQSRLALAYSGRRGDGRSRAPAKKNAFRASSRETDLAHRLGMLAVETALRN